MDTQFEEFNKERQEPNLYQYRLKYFNLIKNSKLPSFRYGLSILMDPDFDFNNVQPIANPKFNLTINHPKSVEIYSNNEIKDLNDFMIEEDEDRLYYFNQAFANNLLLIKIPKDIEVKEPIEINYDSDDSLISSVFVLAEPNSKAQILVTRTGKTEKYTAETVKIIAKENSIIDFITIQNIDKSVNIQKKKSYGKKNSTVNWIDVCLGTRYTKSEIKSFLNDEGARTNQTVLYLGSENQMYDIYTASIHNAPNTFSNIITKGVLNHKAKALSRGLVKIQKNAAGSNGYEKQDTLLLTDTAEADAIPNLEIDNNEVKCSHGSTIGQLDTEKMFYLMSRGLNEEMAMQKIVEGYFMPVLDLFEDKVKEKIHNLIIKSLSK